MRKKVDNETPSERKPRRPPRDGDAKRRLSRRIVAGYRAMAADRSYEREATKWIENLAGDVADEGQ